MELKQRSMEQELNNQWVTIVELSMKKNKRGEMRGRCREQRKGGDAESQRAKEGREGGGVAECRFRVRKLSIYTCFIFKWWSGWTGSVRFGSIGFRLWKLKLNRTGIFLWFFNRLIRFFQLFFFIFSVFLLTPTSMKSCPKSQHVYPNNGRHFYAHIVSPSLSRMTSYQFVKGCQLWKSNYYMVMLCDSLGLAMKTWQMFRINSRNLTLITCHEKKWLFFLKYLS